MTNVDACRQMHMGPWMIEPHYFNSAVSAWKAGLLVPLAAITEVVDGAGDTIMRITDDGIAVIDMIGPMTKGQSKFGGASTIQLRKAFRAAAVTPDISAVVLRVESPGGTVAGTQEAADDFGALAAVKPTLAHIEDMGASAALWVIAEAGVGNVSANALAMIGSIGAIGTIEDVSGAFEKEGIVVRTFVSDGATLKAAGVRGTELSEDAADEAQRHINVMGKAFVGAFASARGMDPSDIIALKGGMFVAADAKAAGLIDHVRSFDQTMEAARGLAQASRNDRRVRESNARRLQMGR